jgi:thioredoxin-related protein
MARGTAMGVIKLFWKDKCPRCPQAKEVGSSLQKDGYTVLDYNVETAEGLAEATFYNVQATPTFILEDPEENAIADFRGEVPSAQKVKELLANCQN